jgi:DNA-binding transcriptional regulator YdaS (Cro superfamily)
MDALSKAIAIYGNQSLLADALGVSQPAVANWFARGVPIKQALRIEQLTRGKVKARQLCPDAFVASPAPQSEAA